MSGVRSVKIAEGLRHEYITQNGHVVRDTVADASTGAFQYTLDFTYDESGHPLTMRRYKNEAQTSYNTYHYVVNGQGDVVKLLYGSSNTVAEYSYDAYGNVLTKSGSLADVNPLRYRGYYCDTETGFYYLQSRYYDPIIRRFLNADTYASTGQGFLGYNMFAYCNNNPVICSDHTGCKCRITDGTDRQDYGDGLYAYSDTGTGVKYIKHQNDPSVANKSLGISTVKHSGCGPTSIYNVLIGLSAPKDFDSILDNFNGWNSITSTIFLGLAGMMPADVGSYLESLGYIVRYTDGIVDGYFDSECFDAVARTADECILWYLYKTDSNVFGLGGHFFEFHKYNGKFIGYNVYSNVDYYIFDSPAAFAYSGNNFFAVLILIYKPKG